MPKKYVSNLFNEHTKVLLENFFSLSVSQLVGLLSSLVVLPYVLRIIGVAHYGEIIFIMSLGVYFQTLIYFGFGVTAVRDINTFKDNKKKINLIYSKVMLIKIVFLVISALLIFILTISFAEFYELRLLVFFRMMMLIGDSLFPDWFFQGIEQMKYIAYLNVGAKIFFIFGIFTLLKSSEDYWQYFMLQGVSSLILGFLGQFFLYYKYQIKFHFLKYKSIIQSLKKDFPIFANQYLPILYNNTTIFLLGLLQVKTAVGVFHSINTIVLAGMMLLYIVSKVFFPFLNKNKAFFQKYQRLVIVFTMIIMLAILICNRFVFWYLNIENSKENFIVLLVLLLGFVGYAFTNIYELNYFIIRRKDRLVLHNTMIASFLGVLISYPLIYRFGVIGAAVTITIVRSFMGGRIYYKYLITK